MGRETEIAWTDHTFNPIRGCRHATLPDGSTSPACIGCYAEAMAKRNPATLGEWGVEGARVEAAEPYWRQPFAWNDAAAAAGVRRRVFCASLGDLFEGRDVGGVEQRAGPRLDYVPMLNRLFRLIEVTPWLDWQLLTKRPWNAYHYHLWRAWPWPDNAWIGATVENQAAADDRIPWLLRVPARVRFLSMEPLFGRVDLDKLWCHGCDTDEHVTFEPPKQPWCRECDSEVGGAGWLDSLADAKQPGINWIILAGQSGPGAAMLDLGAVRDVMRQCREAEVPVFVKQLGTAWARVHGARHPKGGDPDEWPEDLRVREFPEVARG